MNHQWQKENLLTKNKTLMMKRTIIAIVPNINRKINKNKLRINS